VPVEDTNKVKGLAKNQKNLSNYVDTMRLYLSVQKAKNSRKKVDHNSKTQTARGQGNRKMREKDNVTNADLITYLKEKDDFNVFLDAFNPSKNSQTEWNTIKRYLLSKDATTRTRLGNGVVGFVRNYLDRQTWKHNKQKTIKRKGFDKFGIDSRQLQESIGYEFKFKKGGK
jgi:hypothetical protein